MRVLKDQVPAADVDWSTELEALLDDPGRISIALQPIVDLKRAQVVGYEALARVAGRPPAGPDVWFERATRAGVGPELDALCIAKALEVARSLPKNCFLSINVDPSNLLTPVVEAALTREGDLETVVLEITEKAAIGDYAAAVEALRRYRKAGALVAVDDAGTGYSNLMHIISLRPEFVKLDRSVIANCDREEAKAAIIEMLGHFGSRVDAWLVAEGLERQGELDAVIRMGVPLGQGYWLGCPAPRWAGIKPEQRRRILKRVSVREGSEPSIDALVEGSPSVPIEEWQSASSELIRNDPWIDVVIATDDYGRPAGLVFNRRGDQPHALKESPLRVRMGSSVTEVLQRAMTRPAEDRFNPIVCCDCQGRAIGVIRIERLVERLMK